MGCKNCRAEIDLGCGLDLVGSDVAVLVDPAVCNALSCSPAGLLVPQTDLVGVVGASCPPTTTTRSIDVDVVETPGCPDVWTIGARLSPCAAQLENPATFGLATAPGSTGVWQVVTGFQIALPEAGCYDLQAEVGGNLSLTNASAGIILVARLFDVTAGAALPASQREIIQANIGNLNAANPYSIQATAPVGALYCVAAPATIRVEAQVFWTSGTGATITAAQIFGGGRAVGTSTIRYHKYAD